MKKILWILIALVFSASAIAENALEITVSSLSELATYPTKSVPATVLSLNTSVLSAQVSGNVTAIHHPVGDVVREGEPLMSLQCQDYEYTYAISQAELKAAQVDLDFANWQLKRAIELRKQKNVSEETLRSRQADQQRLTARVEQLKANEANAKLQVDRCVVKAPFSGVISERQVDLGEWVGPGAKLLSLVDTENLEIEARCHLDEINWLQQADERFFQSNQKSYPVSIRAVVGALDPSSRTQLVRLKFNKTGTLPGTPGRLIWHNNVAHLPAEFVRQLGNKSGVFITQDNKRAMFYPLPEAIEGQTVPIDLPLTTQVIVSGRYALKDGQAIQIRYD